MRHKAEIPDWFQLSKYDGLVTMSPVEFALNLAARVQILIYLTGSEDSNKEQVDFARNLIEVIKRSPSTPKSQLEDIYLSVKERDMGLSRTGFMQGAGLGVVTSLPLRSAFEIYEAIDADTELRDRVARYRYYLSIDPAKDTYKTWYESVFNKVSINEVDTNISVSDVFFEEIISVNFAATDDELIEGFKDWLKVFRAKFPSMPGITQSIEKTDLSDLLGYKRRLLKAAVIPFIDLRIHEKLEQIRLPLHKVGNAIYPSDIDIDTSEAVRKTTRSVAKHALRNSFLFLRRAILEESAAEAEKNNN